MVKADGAQPEFTRPVWECWTAPSRHCAPGPGPAGRTRRHTGCHRAALRRRPRDPGRHLGMEDRFGQFMGEQSVIRSLATLAYEGRRPRFAEDQLLAALQILQSGDISSSGLRGSWASAMEPNPVHSHHLPDPRGGLRRRRPSRHLELQRRRPGLGRPLPAGLRLAEGPRLGHSGGPCRAASTTPWPTPKYARPMPNGMPTG